jgi:hypothetical protein
MALSDLVRGAKNNSTNFINDNNWVKGKFPLPFYNQQHKQNLADNSL